MKRKNSPLAEMTLEAKAMAALREAVAGVVEEHRRTGRLLALWQEGKVVMTPADKVAPPPTLNCEQRERSQNV